jgi:hypothetical protein
VCATLGRRATQVVLTLICVALAGATPARSACVGDCDGNGVVAVNELIGIVRIVLGNASLAECPAADADGDSALTVDEVIAAVGHGLDGCPLEPGRTIDDLFADVAQAVPEFGGMYLVEDGLVLEIFLRDPTSERTDAAAEAIRTIFGEIIPEGGIRARQGTYGFLQLREWYAAIVGGLVGIPGVVSTDIDEAANRLAIGIATADAEDEILDVVSDLGIPGDAVAVTVTGPIEPLTHTLQAAQSPRRGGFQITRLINNMAGSGITAGTLGFNAVRAGQPGLVTNSHNTQRFWNLDTNAGFPPADFYQAPGFVPAQWVGTEMVDTQAFTCPPPYPSSGYFCRYSDSAFARYNTGVAFDPGIIGKATAQTMLTTTSATVNLTVDHLTRFTVIGAPTMPYLVGLTLHKVGRTTGWTTGTIAGTCLDYQQTNSAIHPGTTVRRCQYLFGNVISGIGMASFGDSGSPVFRLVDAQCGYVELYGILWGGGIFFVPPAPWTGGSVGKVAAFSPIGGVAFQQAGIQSPQDLGPLSYTTAGLCTPIARPTATATRTSTATSTRTRTATHTPTPRPTQTATRTASRTRTHTPLVPPPTFTSTPTATATPTGCFVGQSSNLVLNPSFESYTSLPTTLGQLNLASPWTSASNGSPDYFHALATSVVGVPGNTFGSEPAHTGMAYAGFHARPPNSFREYVEVPLSSPLAGGTTYLVSFYLSLADHSRWAVDKLGAYLATGPVGPVNTAYVIAVSPQVNVSGYVTNKTGWVPIQGAYTASGGESHLVIGNFFDNPSTTPLIGSGALNFAYYYIDDVSVTLAGVPCTPTATATRTHTSAMPPCPPGVVCTPTASATASRTPTPRNTATISATGTATRTATRTASASATRTPTATPRPSATSTSTRPPPPTLTATRTATGTATRTRTTNIFPEE